MDIETIYWEIIEVKKKQDRAVSRVEVTLRADMDLSTFVALVRAQWNHHTVKLLPAQPQLLVGNEPPGGDPVRDQQLQASLAYVLEQGNAALEELRR